MAREVKDGLRATARESEAAAIGALGQLPETPGVVNAQKLLLALECKERFGEKGLQKMSQLLDTREMTLTEVLELVSDFPRQPHQLAHSAAAAAAAATAEKDDGPKEYIVTDPDKFLNDMETNFTPFSAGSITDSLRKKYKDDPRRLLMYATKSRYDQGLKEIEKRVRDWEVIKSGDQKGGNVGALVTARRLIERMGAGEHVTRTEKDQMYLSLNVLAYVLSVRYELVAPPSTCYEVLDAVISGPELQDALLAKGWLTVITDDDDENKGNWSTGEACSRADLTRIRKYRRKGVGVAEHVYFHPWHVFGSKTHTLGRIVFDYRNRRAEAQGLPRVVGRPWSTRRPEMTAAWADVDEIFQEFCKGK